MVASFLHRIRLTEAETAIKDLSCAKPAPAVLLEIGAGSGWQASHLAGAGYRVEAIDVAESHYLKDAVWPVTIYDGRRIPFPDKHFDIVFTSNVLEHIPDIAELLREMRRVLRPDGVALHLLPTATWRFWTSLTHYPATVGLLWNASGFGAAIPLTSAQIGSQEVRSGDAVAVPARRPLLHRISQILIPQRHGELGNVLTETIHFSRLRWSRLFRSAGWTVKRRHGNSLFYTGYSLLDARLGLPTRRLLSTVLGSSCHIYILEPRPIG